MSLGTSGVWFGGTVLPQVLLLHPLLSFWAAQDPRPESATKVLVPRGAPRAPVKNGAKKRRGEALTSAHTLRRAKDDPETPD
jgi:hypothetical protein